jgi:hypothetical protein
MSTILERGTNFIWKNARLLERAIFDLQLGGGSANHVIEVLRTYQAQDGGFGHALEPDLRAPDSHPLFVEFALRVLYECKIHDSEIAYRTCDFLSKHADLKRGIATIFPSSQRYPRAAHWNNPGNQEPSFDRLTGLVGLVKWQGVDHPWLPAAVDACLEYLMKTRFVDAHTILTSFCLVESVSASPGIDQLFHKLSRELFTADYFRLEAPVKSYGVTPLAFAPTPSAYCRSIFSDAQIVAHLDDLETQQQEDGGWPILWEPPGEMARCEWRGYKTVMALATLHAYGRI